jgi:hypothetical protein
MNSNITGLQLSKIHSIEHQFFLLLFFAAASFLKLLFFRSEPLPTFIAFFLIQMSSRRSQSAHIFLLYHIHICFL